MNTSSLVKIAGSAVARVRNFIYSISRVDFRTKFKRCIRVAVAIDMSHGQLVDRICQSHTFLNFVPASKRRIIDKGKKASAANLNPKAQLSDTGVACTYRKKTSPRKLDLP